jgi:hypothetical protein
MQSSHSRVLFIFCKQNRKTRVRPNFRPNVFFSSSKVLRKASREKKLVLKWFGQTMPTDPQIFQFHVLTFDSILFQDKNDLTEKDYFLQVPAVPVFFCKYECSKQLKR